MKSDTAEPCVAPAPIREVLRGRLGQLTAGLLLLEFVSAIQVFTVSTVMPQIAGEFHSQRWYGFATTAIIIATVIAVPLSGPLVDRYGLKRVLNVATPVYVAGALVAALAPSMPLFVAGRLAQGFASGMMSTFGLRAVTTEFPERHRVRVMSLMSSMWILPALIGPPYAAFTAALLGWRWSLLLLLPFLFVARFLVTGRITSFHGEVAARRGLPLARALILAGGMLLFLSGSGAQGAWGFVRLAAGLACVLVALHGIFPQGTLRARRGPESAVLAMLLLCFAFYGAESLVTLMATRDLGASLTQAGLALTFGAICRSSASLLLPRLTVWPPMAVGSRIPALGAVLIVIAFALVTLDIATMGRSGTAMWLTWPSWAIGGAGMGLVYTPVSLASLDIASRHGAGRAASAVALAETVGALVGMACGAAIAAQVIVPAMGYTGLSFGFFTFAAVPLLIVIPRMKTPA